MSSLINRLLSWIALVIAIIVLLLHVMTHSLFSLPSLLRQFQSSQGLLLGSINSDHSIAAADPVDIAVVSIHIHPDLVGISYLFAVQWHPH